MLYPPCSRFPEGTDPAVVPHKACYDASLTHGQDMVRLVSNLKRLAARH